VASPHFCVFRLPLKADGAAFSAIATRFIYYTHYNEKTQGLNAFRCREAPGFLPGVHAAQAYARQSGEPYILAHMANI
jgi:hypothetical protein